MRKWKQIEGEDAKETKNVCDVLTNIKKNAKKKV
jgi:hypothetical protein